ncbi:UrcA family protein [Sphingobium sp. AN558]|uniref:UrcA family protein n=1 Tax=Sphingobium sp. AN558 TaxID=3133442 RepID=UPI0030C24DE6
MFSPVNSFIKPIVILGACALLPLSAASAAGTDAFESNGRTMDVRYGDLNLASKADQATLRSRLIKASWKVCSGETAHVVEKCRSAALAHVRAPVAAAIASAERGDQLARTGGETKVAIAR